MKKILLIFMFVIFSIFNLFASYLPKDNLIDNIVSDINIFPSDELANRVKEKIDEKNLAGISQNDLDYIVSKIIDELEKKYSKSNSNDVETKTYVSVVSDMDYLVEQVSEAIDRINDANRSLSSQDISIIVKEISDKINENPQANVNFHDKWYILVLKIAIVLTLIYLIYLLVMKIIFWHKKIF